MEARRCWLCWIAALLVMVAPGCQGLSAPKISATPARPLVTEAAVMTVTSTPALAATTSATASARVTAEVVTTPLPTPTPEPTEEIKTVSFTIVYDNNSYDSALRPTWGFACWVEMDGMTVLFDTGGDSATLLHNLGELGLDPRDVDAVVLSHAHGDHTGGLGAVLGSGSEPTVYVPTSFSQRFKDQVRAQTDLVEVSDPVMLFPGIHSTGEVRSSVVEQALVVETSDGLVVVTGCAHPGIVNMVRIAKEVAGDDVALVMGGFHLGGASLSQVERIVGDFRKLGVKRVAPCHCTGDTAREAFVDAFGEDAALAGVGWSTEFVIER